MTFQTWAILFLAWGTVDFAICYLIYLHKQKTKVMKVGSLVEYIGPLAPKGVYQHAGFIQLPSHNTIYTVRDMVISEPDGRMVIMVEEMCFGINLTTNEEMGIRVIYFRELQPPMDLSFIEEMQITEQVKVLK